MRRKKGWVFAISVVVLLAVFFVPIPRGTYKDGGTKEYTALAYKIVDWNRLTEDGVYEKTRVYTFGERFQSIDELWEREEAYTEKRFLATVVEQGDSYVLVEPVEDEWERRSGDRISFATTELTDIGATVGSVVEVIYSGGIRETYPASIDVIDWKMSKDLQHLSYTGEWLDKTTAEKREDAFFSDIIITEIYSDCFFATPVIPMPYEIKLNGVLSEEWCVGDQVVVKYENTYYDKENHRVEADFTDVAVSDFVIDTNVCYKPVIYLYPEKEMQVSVKLALDGGLTCTYPAYEGGWTVTASPDGTLTDAAGQTYNYLYWEGETVAQYDYSKGFCIKGEDTAAFLEDALEKLGLTRREANEFIVFWLPMMQENPYNIISFQTECYADAAKLEVNPVPDTLIRVFMAWQASDTFVEMEEQVLSAPERTGFTVVEWGGTECK